MVEQLYFKKLLELLDQRGQLPAAAKQSSMPHGAAVLSKLLNLGIAPAALSEGLENVFQLPLYSASEDGELEIVGKDGEWGVQGDCFYIMNPFDLELQPAVVLSPERSATIHRLGLLPVAIADSVVPSARDQIEAEVRLKQWITKAVDLAASDVHITPLSSGYVRVRVRVDGSLQVLTEIPMHSDQPGQSYRNISNLLMRFAGLESGSFTRPVDGRFQAHFLPGKIEIRMHMRPVVVQGLASQAFYLRLFNNNDSEKLKRVARLNLPSKISLAFARLRRLNQSLVLIAGPTGSGKSTTLYANLRELLHEMPDRSIQTLEDPVECHIEGIEQTEINERAGVSFEKGLRAMMRSDVDVILIGEIRDSETAKLAIRASLTGHLVFATIHAKSSLAAIERFVDFGVSRKMLAMVLSSVFAQRLVRKFCSTCRGKHTEKCTVCEDGYQGRYLIVELVNISSGLREAIAQGDNFYHLESIVQDNDNLLLWDCAHDVIRRGITTHAECEKQLPPDPLLASQSSFHNNKEINNAS